MLLERLREYALVQLADMVPPPGYQEQPVRYIVPLTLDGKVEGPPRDTVDKDAKRGQVLKTPHAKRASGIVPKLLADTGEYVFGIARNDPKKPANPDRVAEQHRQFRDLVAACARKTDDTLVQAVEKFYESYEPGTLPPGFSTDYDPSATVTFRVDGRLPIDLPTVRSWWAATRAPDTSDANDANGMVCIGCGQERPVLERLPLRIKGIPGSMPQGYDLISANSPAFESYGLKASKTAPTCASCAEAYGNALNALLADKSTSIRAGELAYAFWTEPRKPVSFGPAPLLVRPQETAGEVRELLTSFFSGKDAPLFLDPTRFYSVALGTSGARIVVKDWIDTTVGHARDSIARFFALQQMVEWDGEPGEPMSLMTLARSTVRRKPQPPQDDPPDVVVEGLMRLALHGTRLSDELLFMAVRRNRAEQNVSRARAALIRMVLDRDATREHLKEARMAGLDPERTDPAYVCGRLLAIADQIQFATLGDVNSSVVDKYFASASANPGLVFPIINRGAQFHLKRLARDNGPAQRSLQAQYEEVTAMIDDYPIRLDLKGQGVFQLGFYHQRAADRAARKRASATKSAASTVDDAAPTEELND